VGRVARGWAAAAAAIALAGCAGAEVAALRAGAERAEAERRSLAARVAALERRPVRPEALGLAARGTLAALYRDLGRRRFEAFRFREAEVALERALALDPDDAEARDLHARVAWITTGRPVSPGVAAALRGATCGDRGRSIEEATARVRGRLAEARGALAGGRRADAVAACEEALEVVRWFPYRLGDEGEDLAAEARALLAEAWPPAEAWPGGR